MLTLIACMAAYIAIVTLTLCCCVVAGRADERAEEMLRLLQERETADEQEWAA